MTRRKTTYLMSRKTENFYRKRKCAQEAKTSIIFFNELLVSYKIVFYISIWIMLPTFFMFLNYVFAF